MAAAKCAPDFPLPEMRFGLILLGVCLLACPAWTGAPQVTDSNWLYLDNGQLRLGIDTRRGGCLGYLSLSTSRHNLLNHHDTGRFIQQSYYGDPDGTFWGKQPWRWNPVQGGDFKGNPAKLLEARSSLTNLYTRGFARHWSGCIDLTNVVFEESIRLTGLLAHAHYTMSYYGDKAHAITSQEIPAVFIEPEYKTLVLYSGPRPWTGAPLDRSVPGWPNESRRTTEHWAACVNDADFGIGAFVPIATNLTCYRYKGAENNPSDSCSYFAPVGNFAVRPGFKFEYDLYLTIGSVSDIRSRFEQLATKNKP
jgi:hypothetical protein